MANEKPGPREIVYRSPADLKPDPNNSRLHSEEQILQLMASHEELGWTNPILLRPSGMIGAGHARWEMAKRKGLAAVPTITLHGLSEAQWRALVIADNKLALNATWHVELLTTELSQLNIGGFDINVMGFSLPELSALEVPGFKMDERLGAADETPPLPTIPVVRSGDVWLCGKQRIACGDSTKKLVVTRALNGNKPNLMVTDPPYGVKYDANWRNEVGISLDGSVQRIKTGRVRKKLGARAIAKVNNDDRADWREAWALFPGNVAYVWHGALHASLVQESLESVGLNLRAQIIWNKARFVISRGDYHYKHEPCWYAVRKGKPGNWCAGRDQTSVWDIAHNKSETGHSTQKPVDCMRRPILNNSKPGDFVYDPFLGSGTTMIAAEMEGRACFGIEIDPAYVEMAVVRWENFTKDVAKREDGKTLEELKGHETSDRGKSIPMEKSKRAAKKH